MLNVVAIMGRLVRDPELKQTNSGTSVCSFTVAVDAYSKGDEKKAYFFSVVAWRGTAEFVSKYFQKGSMIAVSGSLQQRNYEDKDGNKRTVTEILAQNVNFCGGKETGQATQKNDSGANHVDAVPSYSTGSNDDFALIDAPEDLPF